jgi:hypothetical protein
VTEYVDHGVMIARTIDVWDVDTFDDELFAKLDAKAETICSYFVTETENFIMYKTSDLWAPHPSNPYAGAYRGFLEDVDRLMKYRTMRAWHYTRLTDPEVDAFRSAGVHVSTLETLRRRLDAQVNDGLFSAVDANAIFAASPLQHAPQLEGRTNRFWMTSSPVSVDDDGVIPLLSSWGGEVVYFWLPDPFKKLVAGIGKPRVFEIAVPLDVTCHTYSAAEAIAATFGRTLDCKPDKNRFDLCATRALGSEALIAIHTEGEPDFAALARGYPAAFKGS